MSAPITQNVERVSKHEIKNAFFSPSRKGRSGTTPAARKARNVAVADFSG